MLKTLLLLLTLEGDLPVYVNASEIVTMVPKTASIFTKCTLTLKDGRRLEVKQTCKAIVKKGRK